MSDPYNSTTDPTYIAFLSLAGLLSNETLTAILDDLRDASGPDVRKMRVAARKRLKGRGEDDPQ